MRTRASTSRASSARATPITSSTPFLARPGEHEYDGGVDGSLGRSTKRSMRTASGITVVRSSATP